MSRNPTVFISSRMEELAMERRAAFAAVAEAGLTPLVFETEPKRQEKEKIDLLVDRADYFIGLYYMTFGNPSEELFGLSPIEYEFLRFCARFDVVNTPESYRLSQTDRSRIGQALASSAYRDELRQRIEADKVAFSGHTPIVLFQRVSRNEDLTISSRLSAFLAKFTVEHFGNEERRPPAGAPVTEERYLPSHVSLFEALHGWALAERARDPLPLVSEEADWRVYGKVKRQDRPGLLYFTLKGFFDFGLNIDGSWAIVYDQNGEDVDKPNFLMHLQARNFHFLHEFRELREEISDVVGYELLGEHFSLLGADEEERFPVELTQLSPSEIDGRIRNSNVTKLIETLPDAKGITYYSISAYDVPGALMEIARLVYHFAGSIHFVCSGRFAVDLLNGTDALRLATSGVSVGPIVLGILFPDPSGAARASFEYELLSLLSVTVVARIDRTELQERVVAWKKRAAESPGSPSL